MCYKFIKRKEVRKIKLIKTVVDKKPKTCVGCTLSIEYKRDCGKEKAIRTNGGMTYTKEPDARCKLTVVNKEE